MFLLTVIPAREAKWKPSSLKAVSYTHLDVYKRQVDDLLDETTVELGVVAAHEFGLALRHVEGCAVGLGEGAHEEDQESKRLLDHAPTVGDLKVTMKLDGAQVWASIEATTESARQLLEGCLLYTSRCV